MDDHQASENQESEKEPSINVGIDPPLTANGKQQAFHTGQYLRQKIHSTASIRIHCSPFMRCLQTADALLNGMELTNKDIEVREQLSELLIGCYNEAGAIDKLLINSYGKDDIIKDGYLSKAALSKIKYDRSKGFKMVYPEPFFDSFRRYNAFFNEASSKYQEEY